MKFALSTVKFLFANLGYENSIYFKLQLSSALASSDKLIIKLPLKDRTNSVQLFQPTSFVHGTSYSDICDIISTNMTATSGNSIECVFSLNNLFFGFEVKNLQNISLGQTIEFSIN